MAFKVGVDEILPRASYWEIHESVVSLEPEC